MFNKTQFSQFLVRTFGSKDEKIQAARADLRAGLEFCAYHCARHANTDPAGRLAEAVAKGGGLKHAIREALKTVPLPEKGRAEEEAATALAQKWVDDMLAVIDAATEVAAEKRAEKAEARKKEKEKELADAVNATRIITGAALVAADGALVTLSEDEFSMLAEFLGSLRAKDVTPAPLAIAA